MQSRKHSLAKSLTQTGTGLVISWIFTFYALPLFGVAPSKGAALWITLSYFLLSLLRQYLIERAFVCFPTILWNIRHRVPSAYTEGPMVLMCKRFVARTFSAARSLSSRLGVWCMTAWRFF